jgi:hypothetical protein
MRARGPDISEHRLRCLGESQSGTRRHCTPRERRAVEIVGLFGSSEMQALFSLGDGTASTAIRGRAGGFPANGQAKVRVGDPETQRICEAGEVGELEIFAPQSRLYVTIWRGPETSLRAMGTSSPAISAASSPTVRSSILRVWEILFVLALPRQSGRNRRADSGARPQSRVARSLAFSTRARSGRSLLSSP